MKTFASRVYFANQLPEFDSEQSLLIFDKALLKKNGKFRRWIKGFPLSYGVKAGEEIKNFDRFSSHLKKLSSLAEELSPKQMQVLAVGGGSVGDFAGFFASIYKRGVKLIQIPTTYLSAIDSAHGGKTALNLTGGKNQIGSFYPAEQVWIVSDLLKSQTDSQLSDARGELAKIALIDTKVWNLVTKQNELISFSEFVKLIKPAVEAKMRIVQKDPFEKSGVRQVLNLGHTLGHVIEASLGLSHGTSVAQGLIFSLRWSYVRGLLPARELNRIEELLEKRFAIAAAPIGLKRTDFETLLKKDKKRSSAHSLIFVFVKSVGKAVTETVRVEEILREAIRQGWLRK